MNELELPEQLCGPWENVLILTYGVDVPFFENALWNQFSARCRNKIILADGQSYLDSCIEYARGGLVRYLNQRYLVEGILAPHAAHAKAILLTNPERGRLLVGSGNLGWQGYASGGELFTQYEYSSEEPTSLNAFLVVRELVDGLVARQYVGAPAVRRIQHLWEQTPWLFRSPEGNEWPVRHNLESDFLSQLQQIVGNEPVEEMWVLSPFYDREVVALQTLLTTFDPRQATLLLQASHTSVDPAALKRVLRSFGARCRVRSFSRGSDSPYIHAKMVLLKSRSRAICLQGSPNLSQVAMLLHLPQGNVELVNLLTGPRHFFDGLLGTLDIESTAASLGALDLHYQPSHTSVGENPEGWRLTSGEWQNDRLFLHFRGLAPDLSGASLVVGDHGFPLELRRIESQTLELGLSPATVGLLNRPVPVAVRWGGGDSPLVTNPIFVCNRTALDAALEITAEGESLDRFGDLDLDDAEFQQLLAELEAALVIDRRSVWSMAGRKVHATADDDEEGIRLNYLDIDYDMLRQHPKLRQYAVETAGGQGYVRSRLQIILSSITDHFRGLLDASTAAKELEEALAGLKGSQTESEEDREQEEEEKQVRHRTQAQRLRRILKSFIQRYLRGLNSSDFQELAGAVVMAQNYVIFSYLLWRLLAKDWVEPEFVIDSLLQTWTLFWGQGSQPRYFERLGPEDQVQVLQLVQGDQHADAVMVASLYYAALTARLECWDERRFALRDFWVDMLRRSPFALDARVVENTWRIVAEPLPYDPPLPGAIIEELARLARFETQDSFLRSLEQGYDYPRGSCAFEKVRVYREPLDRSDTVECLMVRVDGALPNQDAAASLLRSWMRFAERDYYRISTASGDRILLYEGLDKKGLYFAKDLDKEVALGPVEAEALDWDITFSHLRGVASQVEEGLALRVREPSLSVL